jgi:hypothetical protein
MLTRLPYSNISGDETMPRNADFFVFGIASAGRKLP